MVISVIRNEKVTKGPGRLSVTANFPLLPYPLLMEFCYKEIKKKKSEPDVSIRYNAISVTLGSGIAHFYRTWLDFLVGPQHYPVTKV